MQARESDVAVENLRERVTITLFYFFGGSSVSWRLICSSEMVTTYKLTSSSSIFLPVLFSPLFIRILQLSKKKKKLLYFF